MSIESIMAIAIVLVVGVVFISITILLARVEKLSKRLSRTEETLCGHAARLYSISRSVDTETQMSILRDGLIAEALGGKLIDVPSRPSTPATWDFVPGRSPKPR